MVHTPTKRWASMMKKLIVAMVLALCGASTTVQARLNVFACEPEWKALAEEIGGKQVKAQSATTAFQDPHYIEARPSLIARMRRADVVICTGAELEVGWLPLLLRQSGGKAVQPGQVGHFMAAEQVELIEKPVRMDRSMGDIHAAGNPHVHLDPNRLSHIAAAFTDRLQQIDPGNKDYYADRLEKFRHKWRAAIRNWVQQAAPLKGAKVVVQHKSFSYLLAWLGIEVIANMEPKPGIPPTSSHLATVLQLVRTEKPLAILLTAYEDDKAARWLANKSAVPALRLPYTVGGNEESSSLLALYDNTLNQLVNTLARP